MIEYLSGTIAEINPTYVVVDVSGVGYFLNISLFTFEQIKDKKEVKIFVHQIIREDSFTLYGFADKDEREIFRLLISVSGIGAATARLMLSSLKPDEIRTAIVTGDVQLIKSVKGIGLKTAQRIIVDIKDKVDSKSRDTLIVGSESNRNEAIDALVVLGFSRKAVEKAVHKVLSANPQASVEYIIKESFKYLT